MTKNGSFIDFLKTYGPSSSSKAMYDEHVLRAAEEYSVAPIHVDSPLVAELVAGLRGDDPHSVILTGTAGDGKTWHARQAFSLLEGSDHDWNAAEGIVELTLASGRRLHIVKDLSQLHEDPRQEAVLGRFLDAVLGHDASNVFMLCANDGQLLRFFRLYAKSDGRAHGVEEVLRTMLKDNRETDQSASSLRLAMYNLSRRPQGDLFDKLVDAVAHHPGWATSETCPSPHAERDPIRRNLAILSKSPMRDRLRDLIGIAAANDTHLPMRHLLLLIVNVILGVSGQKKTSLMTSKVSGALADADEAYMSNPYDNALGMNLKLDGSRDYLAFTLFRNAGIGFETNNAIDTLLLEKQPEGLHAHYLAADAEHGAKRFEESRTRYRKGETEDFGDFQRMLEAQRRRLFFVLPRDPKGGELDPWRLSVFMHGGTYVDFCESLKQGQPADRTVGCLVIGLNRTYSGVMCDDSDRLWFTAPAANTQSRMGRVLDIALPLGEAKRDVVAVKFDSLGPFGRPRIVVTARESFSGPPKVIESNDLTPLLFEYLMRVQGGSLPGSFSRQCFEELRQFRLRVVAKLSRLELITLDDLQDMQIVKLGSDGRLSQDSIGVARSS